jgi:hypothetical protein
MRHECSRRLPAVRKECLLSICPQSANSPGSWSLIRARHCLALCASQKQIRLKPKRRSAVERAKGSPRVPSALTFSTFSHSFSASPFLPASLASSSRLFFISELDIPSLFSSFLINIAVFFTPNPRTKSKFGTQPAVTTFQTRQ